MRTTYGGAPLVQFNERHSSEVNFNGSLRVDAQLIAKTLGIGFFHYGPRMWMIGNIEPLQKLTGLTERDSIIDQILGLFPEKQLQTGDLLYRVRKQVERPSLASEYDSPPAALSGQGRLDSPGLSVLYASQDIQVCLHECRIAAEDEAFVATLSPTRTLRFLDLAAIVDEGNSVTEFESVDLTVNMLFLAGPHSYDASRAIAIAARDRGYDGIIFPSYFSLLRTGGVPFETVYGITLRRFEEARGYEKSKLIENVAVFGKPVETGLLEVVCINKAILKKVEYSIRFGPAEIPID